ncbi:translation initiation factor IF-2 [Triticum aestivum]|uniref:translation initiation factor IF-2 n=1 Tax=Triticum aestivum TaxID=4565 RepID=UPI001D02F8AD|nr:translation initiation factor IF-2-like [Triticum aestivum]
MATAAYYLGATTSVASPPRGDDASGRRPVGSPPLHADASGRRPVASPPPHAAASGSRLVASPPLHAAESGRRLVQPQLLRERLRPRDADAPVRRLPPPSERLPFSRRDDWRRASGRLRALADQALARQPTPNKCRFASPNPFAVLAPETGESGRAVSPHIRAPRVARDDEASAILGNSGRFVTAPIQGKISRAAASLKQENKMSRDAALKPERKTGTGPSVADNVFKQEEEAPNPPSILKLAEKGSADVAPPFVGATGDGVGGAGRGGGCPGGGGGAPGPGGGGGGGGAPGPGGGGGGGGAPGPGGGDGGGGPGGGGNGPPYRGMAPFPRRLPYAGCQGDGCNVDAVLFCSTCGTIFCQDHVCQCFGEVLRILPMPNLSAPDLQLQQPFAFPLPPTIFVGAYRAGSQITYQFCRLQDVFGRMPLVPIDSFCFDMHGAWVTRTTREVRMVSRAAFFPVPQFLFINV